MKFLEADCQIKISFKKQEKKRKKTNSHPIVQIIALK